MEDIFVGKHKLKYPIYNASGVHCVNERQLDELYFETYTGAVVTKSSTLLPRTGNCYPRYYCSENLDYSINSSGLPNIGMRKYISWIESKPHDKPCILSIAPLSREDVVAQMNIAVNHNKIVDPEVNLSCPNIVGRPQVAYDLEMFEEYNRTIAEIMGEKGYGLKLPPYFDNSIITSVVDIINHINTNSYVTCINSVPNGFMLNDDYQPVIAPNDGFGGFGGKSILPIALASVKAFSSLTNKDIVGCGGITCGIDVKRHIMCGAKAVQIGTVLYENGICEFERIHNEYMSLPRT